MGMMWEALRGCKVLGMGMGDVGTEIELCSTKWPSRRNTFWACAWADPWVRRMVRAGAMVGAWRSDLAVLNHSTASLQLILHFEQIRV